MNHLVKLVRRWGSAASDAALSPECKTFSLPSIEGIISYRLEKNCAIVYGDPICNPQDIPELTKGFHTYCKKEKLSIIYLVASSSFQQWALSNQICSASIQFGEELTIDPHDDPRAREGTQASLVRRKVRHAQKEGTVVEEFLNNTPALEKEMENIAKEWVSHRKGLQVHISNVFLFKDQEGKRWLYAKKNGKIMGVLVLNRLESKQGWLLNHVMTSPEASHGTPEYLVIAALDMLREENCHYVTFGAITTGVPTDMQGLNLFSKGVAKLFFKMANRLFHLDNRKVFWEKFHPKSEPSYLLFSDPYIGINQIHGLVKGLNISF